MRKLVSLSLVVVVCLLVAHFTGGESANLVPLRADEVSQAQSMDEMDLGASALAPATPEAPQRREALEARVPQVVRAEPSESVATQPLAATIRGEVILVDSQGGEWPGLSGEAQCRVWSAESNRYLRFFIDTGHFQLECAEPTEFELRSLTLDGQPALPETMGERLAVDEQRLVLRVVRPPLVELHVTDALTGEHLDHIELRECSTYPAGYASIPSDIWESRPLAQTTSPLTLEAEPLEARRSTSRFLVHSPGYAWQPVVLDMRRPGRYDVHLERACELEVTLEGELPRGLLHLSLYREEPSNVAPLADNIILRERQQAWTDLPAGLFWLRLELGDFYQDRVPVAELLVELVPGSKRSVLLPIEPAATFESAQLGGRVKIAAGWKLDGWGVYANFQGELLDPGKRRTYLSGDKLWLTEGSEDTYLFDFGLRQTGEYIVGVRSGWPEREFEIEKRVELGALGAKDVRLEVLPPCQVVMRVTDAATGELIDCSVMCGSEVDGTPGGFVSVKRVPGADRFEFQAVQGQLRILIHSPDYSPVSETKRVGPGVNTFAFQLERACNVRLVLRDNETSVPWPADLWPEVRGARTQLVSSDGGQRTYAFAEPGRFQLAPFVVEGYESVQNFEFKAVRAETLDYIIQLKRN